MIQYATRLRIASLIVMTGAMSVFSARPFVTDDAGTVESNKFELETAGYYWEDNADFSISLKHGITDRMDLGVCVGDKILPSDERTLSGACIGLKFALIPDRFAVSFSGEFGSATYSANAIATQVIGPVSFDLNFGYEAEAAMKDPDLLYGLAAVYNIGKLGIGAEIGGTQEALNGWQIGARWLIFDWWQIDSGIGGDFENEPNLIATTGFWFSFPLSKDE
jgi:hypothetical protein